MKSPPGEPRTDDPSIYKLAKSNSGSASIAGIHCQQKDVLLHAYVAATDVYAGAMKALVRAVEDENFRIALAHAEKTRCEAEMASVALRHHTQSHGC